MNDSKPTPECLLERLEEARNKLRRRRFHDFVIECALDLVTRVAVRYFKPGVSCDLDDRVRWIFCLSLKAAKQVASRQPSCVFRDPVLLDLPARDSDPHPEVWAALGKLTPQQQAAVYYCEMLDYTLSEAGALMGGLKPSTVSRHRDRGLERLKEILSGR